MYLKLQELLVTEHTLFLYVDLLIYYNMVHDTVLNYVKAIRLLCTRTCMAKQRIFPITESPAVYQIHVRVEIMHDLA